MSVEEVGVNERKKKKKRKDPNENSSNIQSINKLILKYGGIVLFCFLFFFRLVSPFNFFYIAVLEVKNIAISSLVFNASKVENKKMYVELKKWRKLI